MKDCIIGGCYNYNYDQIKYWINSINRSGFNGDKVLVLFDSSDELSQRVEQEGFIVIRAAQDPSIAPHVMRFVSIYDYLSKNDYRFVVTTDVRDVVFQYNPINWIINNFDGHKLVCGSECLRYKDEPWGNQNLYETFGPYVYERFKNEVIYNVGILGGKGSYVRDLCLNIAINSINRPIKICDQAVFNFIINNEVYSKQMYFARLGDKWAAQLGTLNDTNKIHHFGPLLLEQPPTFDGKNVIVDNTPVCIAHQYDRTPWKQAIEEIYK